MNPYELPVYKQKDRILQALAQHQVVVVESPTGSGKTTQLPMILYEAGYTKNGKIGVTQPRRIAAVSVTDYLARQLNTSIPNIIGYKMRFEDRTGPDTYIKIMTDGTLLQEMKTDRYLSQYSVMIVDEAHERSLNIDFILGLLKHVLEARPDFKVIISSATINAEVFSEYFNHCPIVHIETMVYPITMIYDPPEAENSTDGILQKIAEIIGRIMHEQRKGDILVFLSGEKMIKDCMALLYSMPYRRKLHILPLYARLSKEDQELVFIPTPKDKVKVVLATNIAETSVTIDGITSVIDSGLAKTNYYNPKTYTESLVEGPISKASANQRKGRAGRTQPGTCYRLYTKNDFESRELFSLEEIYRTDLSEVVLRMAEIGIRDFESFDFISPPGTQGIVSAIETLRLLDAITEDRELSSIGKLMVEFPLLPRHSRMIVSAIHDYPEVLEEVLIAAAFLSTNSPFLLPAGEEIPARKAHHQFRDPEGDFVSYLNLFKAFVGARNQEKFCDKYYLELKTMSEIVNIKTQLEDIVGGMGIPILSGGKKESYLCAIAKGLIQFVCAKSDRGVYKSLTADRIQIHPSSVMFREDPKFIVAGEIVRTTRMYARSVSPLQREWLERISPELSARLLVKEPAKKVATKAKRDTTYQIHIGGEVFQMEQGKGKKRVVVLPWEKIVKVFASAKPVTQQNFKTLKGKIIYEGSELLSGMKLTSILKIIPAIQADGGILSKWPQGKNYHSRTTVHQLCQEVGNILKLCKGKKQGKDPASPALYTDGEGRYWFKCAKGFNNALSMSLSSLETLADELSQDVDKECIEQVNQAYRKLSSFFEE